MSKPKFLPGDLAEYNGKNVTVTASADFQLCDDCEALLEHRMEFGCPVHPDGCGLHDKDFCPACSRKMKTSVSCQINAGRKRKVTRSAWLGFSTL
jgi:hypothetical protein